MDHVFWLSDEQFERLAPLLPNTMRAIKRVDECRVISGIIQVLLSAGRWKDAPRAYAPRKTIYSRFCALGVKTHSTLTPLLNLTNLLILFGKMCIKEVVVCVRR